jgi:DNA polymerase-3 subunit delta'
MLFKEVLGQQKSKQLLLQMVREERVPHAQLFLGSHGSGNLAMALALAQFVGCTDKQADDSCGICPSCEARKVCASRFAFRISCGYNTFSESEANK